METAFAKLNGLGNDFIFIDDREGSLQLTDEQVRFLCDRHFGIGGDGVIQVRLSPREECTAYMHYINADGTLAQMCGNGVRCFAKYLVDRGIVDPDSGSFIADTLAGPRPISFTVDHRKQLAEATVDMGAPILDPLAVPVNAPADSITEDGTAYVGDLTLESPWGPFSFVCVSMGNPHAVCFLDDLESLPESLFTNPESRSLDTLNIDAIGAYFEGHPVFPEKTNVEFAMVENDGLAMRVFERGCGETLACGTGTCATAVAASLTGRCDRECNVRLLGGALHILWGEDGHVLMTGPAQQSFEGVIDIN